MSPVRSWVLDRGCADFRELRFRNYLINTWTGLDAVSSMAENAHKGAFRPVLPIRGTPIWGLPRIIRQFLTNFGEHITGEVRGTSL